jgi:hypothetical protein
MATIEALHPRLRQLKLSGMVDRIAARVQEARTRPLDPLDFLLLLLEHELMRRETESVDRYIHRARFDEACDLRDFDFTYNPEIPKARIWELASGRFVEECASILLCGPTGVGNIPRCALWRRPSSGRGDQTQARRRAGQCRRSGPRRPARRCRSRRRPTTWCRGTRRSIGEKEAGSFHSPRAAGSLTGTVMCITRPDPRHDRRAGGHAQRVTVTISLATRGRT